MVEECAVFASLQAIMQAPHLPLVVQHLHQNATLLQCNPVTMQQVPWILLIEAGLAVQLQMKEWPLHTFISPRNSSSLILLLFFTSGWCATMGSARS